MKHKIKLKTRIRSSSWDSWFALCRFVQREALPPPHKAVVAESDPPCSPRSSPSPPSPLPLVSPLLLLLGSPSHSESSSYPIPYLGSYLQGGHHQWLQRHDHWSYHRCHPPRLRYLGFLRHQLHPRQKAGDLLITPSTENKNRQYFSVLIFLAYGCTARLNV